MHEDQRSCHCCDLHCECANLPSHCADRPTRKNLGSRNQKLLQKSPLHREKEQKYLDIRNLKGLNDLICDLFPLTGNVERTCNCESKTDAECMHTHETAYLPVCQAERPSLCFHLTDCLAR